MNSILPWHEQAWQYLVNRRNVGSFPHAILIKGKRGIGKLSLAKNLAALLLCQAGLRKSIACGECDACILLKADNHPDLVMVQPEEQGKAIKIDQIREVIADLNNTSHQGGMKVVIIAAAELLNVAAANALLKTLEEPALHTVIILISDHPMMLPATIRSRCQTLLIHTPKYFVARKWLEEKMPDADASLLLALAENAPLQALNLANDSVLLRRQEFFSGLSALSQGKISLMQVTTKCLDWGLDELLLVLMHIASDLMKIKFSANQNVVNKDQIEMLTDWAKKVKMNKLLAYKDRLDEIRKLILNKINLNQQMAVENLIIAWMDLLVPSSMSF